MIKLIVYKKHIVDNLHHTTFEKPFIRYNNMTFEAVISKKCNDKLKDLKDDFPLLMVISDNDYFMKQKTYTRNDKTTGRKWIVVILGFDSAVHVDFQKTTLEDVCEDIQKQQTTVEMVDITKNN